MSQPLSQPTVIEDRLARFRHLRQQLAPARDPADALSQAAYVEHPEAASRRIAAELELAPTSSHVLIGGVGSGKTTELLSVQRRLDAVADTKPLFIDVSRGHDIAKMKPGVVAAQVGLAMAEWIRSERLDATFPATNGPMDELRAIAHGYVDEWADYQGGDDYGYVPGILEAPDPVDEAVQPLADRIGKLLQELKGDRRHFVALLDGLDRITDLQSFEQIVRHDIRALTSLRIGIVLVGPLRALYGIDKALLELFDRFHYQPWFDVQRDENGRQLLRNLLTRRVPPESLENKAIDHLVLYSGGVARDLLALAQSACVEAYLQGVDVVSSKQVDVSIDAFGRKHMQGLRPEELEVLQRLRNRGEFVHTSENELGLLMTRRVLEYRGKNEHPRYVVHPTIADFLE